MAVAFECPCGEAHYYGEREGAYLQRMIDECGPNVHVRILGEGVWSVPRVYAAAHGLHATQLKSVAERYGFLRIAA